MKCLSTTLREYTVKFGRCVVDLHDQLTTTPHGQPPLPGVLPTAQASFEALPVDGLDLGYCKLGEVYEYVRRGKHLAIPADWSCIIPKPDAFK